MEDNIKLLDEWLERLYPIGDNGPGKGVTRLGYTEVEDQMHEVFKDIAREIGLHVRTDELGNDYAETPLATTQPSIWVASHLDSVIQGGRYDGVIGVLAGLLIGKWIVDEKLDIPYSAVAFRCEESSNFSEATIGSGLLTGHITMEEAGERKGKDGRTLAEVFRQRGNHVPEHPILPKEYFETHIEQARVLESSGDEIGIVQGIAAPRRSRVTIQGLAEHSGATPMGIRKDALTAASELILAVEKAARDESKYGSVGTVGIVENQPNVMNVIPGHVELGIDIRGIDADSIHRVLDQIEQAKKKIMEERGVEITTKSLGGMDPVPLTDEVIERLYKASVSLGYKTRKMPSGAGHDAMMFPDICPTGFVFIPCKAGISHNPAEYTTAQQVYKGARVIYETIKEELK